MSKCRSGPAGPGTKPLPRRPTRQAVPGMACGVRWTTAWHPGSSQCPVKVASLAAQVAVGQAPALQQAGHVASSTELSQISERE